MSLSYAVGEDHDAPEVFLETKRAAFRYAKRQTEHYPYQGRLLVDVWEVDSSGVAQGHWTVSQGKVGKVVRP